MDKHSSEWVPVYAIINLLVFKPHNTPYCFAIKERAFIDIGNVLLTQAILNIFQTRLHPRIIES